MKSSKNQKMKIACRRLGNEEGNVLITAFIFLVILTLIGIFATRTAQMDLQIASNEIPYKRNFYIAEGGLYREAAELGRGNYPVNPVTPNNPLARRGYSQDPVGELPEPTVVVSSVKHHSVFDETYDFTVNYLGAFLPPAGYSAIHFVRYDYNVDATANNVLVDSRLYKIGPKAE
ncbi:MAG: pilus assembly PilX N-terminal domain-containing protein [Deltaproteobacteria bacterium]|nr:pilus assembly PilX N-terminal domain-containing protein [Deltaproteobacteria bacterium]